MPGAHPAVPGGRGWFTRCRWVGSRPRIGRVRRDRPRVAPRVAGHDLRGAVGRDPRAPARGGAPQRDERTAGCGRGMGAGRPGLRARAGARRVQGAARSPRAGDRAGRPVRGAGGLRPHRRCAAERADRASPLGGRRRPRGDGVRLRRRPGPHEAAAHDARGVRAFRPRGGDERQPAHRGPRRDHRGSGRRAAGRVRRRGGAGGRPRACHRARGRRCPARGHRADRGQGARGLPDHRDREAGLR